MPDALGRNGQVQPVEGVPGGIPIPFTPVAPTPTTSSGQQNLALASLSLQSAVAAAWIARWVSVSFSAVLVGNETLTITLKSALGAAYDIVVELVNLAPAATPAQQGYIFAFPPEFAMATGDEILVELTNTGAVETATASCVIRGDN
jgi:hypothetical protein